jgi:hypothetical protein
MGLFGESPTVDDKTLQRLLFVCSDILAPYLESRQHLNRVALLGATKTKQISENVRVAASDISNQSSLSPAKREQIQKTVKSLSSGGNLSNAQIIEAIDKGQVFYRTDKTVSDESYITPSEQAKILRRQQELFSDSVIPSNQSARELFADNYSTTPIDTSYIISNFFIIFVGDSPFYFNIDTVNKDNEKFFISKILIKNKSKDAFTLKSNYHVTLRINFTSFDDLLDRSIKAHSVINPAVTTDISLLQILYKYFDFPGAQAGKNLSDPNGLFLIQTLNFNGNYERYKDLYNNLGTDTLSKNYHLTYYKHSFEMFKTEEPVFKYFENELTVEYVAYEADGVDKPVNKSLNKKIVPKVNNNLFRLLDKKSLDGTVLSNPDFLGTSSESFDKIFESYAEQSKTIQDAITQLNCKSDTAAGKQKEAIQEAAKKANEQLKNLKIAATRNLIFSILRECQVYRLKVPYDLIGIYEVSNFKEEFSNSFSIASLLATVGTEVAISAIPAAASVLAGGAGLAAAAGAGLGAIALPGLIAGAGAYAAYALISAALSTKVIENNANIENIRNTVKYIAYQGIKEPGVGDFSYELKDKFLNLAMGGKTGSKDVAKFKQPITSLNGFKDINSTDDSGKKVTKETLEQLGAMYVPDTSDPNLKAEIYFTTFGEIMNILTSIDPSKSLRIISGGYLVDIDVSKGETVFNNFATLPITINSLSQFLYKFIEETERNLNYDSELFFRDCYENLIKSILSDGQAKLDTLKNAAPRNIKVVSTLHIDRGYDTTSWIKDTNILDDVTFNNFKANFLKTKNFNLTSGGLGDKGKLYKTYVIGTYDEIKYYDFYKEYRTWANKNNKTNKRNMLNSDAFQEFINREHLIPCLMMKNISDSESILKKKYVNFSRIDNANLNTGNFLNSSGQMRFPYQFKADFKIFMSFFSDIGSLMFVCPPISNLETKVNMFGFGGLYIIKSAELEYSFQRLQDGKLTIPNLESRYSLDGYMLTHGDSIRNLEQDVKQINKEKDTCAKPIASEPAREVPEGNRGSGALDTNVQ